MGLPPTCHSRVSGNDTHNPHRAVVADAPRIDGPRDSRIGALQTLQENVIPSPQPVCPRAKPRGPGVGRFLSDEPDGSIVQITTDYDERMVSRIREDEAKLVPSMVSADVGDGTEMRRVHPNP